MSAEKYRTELINAVDVLVSNAGGWDDTTDDHIAQALLPILERALADQREGIAGELQERSDAQLAEAQKTGLPYLFGFADQNYQAAALVRRYGKSENA